MRLIELVKPKSYDEFVGQWDILKGNKYRSIFNGNFDILILYGPTGTGKSSFARLLGDYLSAPFYPLHASNTGNSEIKKIMDTAKKTGSIPVIFIDEIHRFSKTQQDLLLDVVDEKYAKIIGASTENPFFALTQALRSRSYFIKFNPLNEEELKTIGKKGVLKYCELKRLRGVVNEEEVINLGVSLAKGDGRKLINFIEASFDAGEINDGMIMGDLGVAELIFGERYNTDIHYDLLSAMIKSIRGSDPDAALVWCFKLLKSGVDPKVIFRRLAISVSEDIGNAFPDAAYVVNALWEIFDKVGMPEGEIIISQVVTFLASCPKSNSSYLACKEVKRYLNEHDPEVPINIVNNAKGYKYPFDHGNFVMQNYFSENKQFYKPSEYGFEKKIKERLKNLWGDVKHYNG
ncbi:MAG: AAA family ATPase [Deferribacterales bacterium]